jgi:hypothetical protein
MRCHYCGTPLGITASALGDADFCSREHRTSYHARLRKGLALLTSVFCCSTPLATAIVGFVPAEFAHGPRHRLEPLLTLRLESAALAVIPDTDAASTSTVSNDAGGDDKTTRNDPGPKHAPPAPLAGKRRIPAGADRAGKLARLAELGSRLGAIRSQLDRVSSAPHPLATA